MARSEVEIVAKHNCAFLKILFKCHNRLFEFIDANVNYTRMHSSRMRTARLLPVYPSMYCSGVYLVPGGVPGPGGVYTWSQGVVPGPGGCTWSGGVPCPGEGTWFWGVYLVLGGVPAQVLPHPVNRMTDRCKNITLPQTSFAGGKNMLYTS